MKSHHLLRPAAGLLLALAGQALTLSYAAPTPPARPAPTDIYGDPVIQQDGKKINYSEAQLRGKKPLEGFLSSDSKEVKAPVTLDYPMWSYSLLQSGLGLSNIRTARNSAGEVEIYLGSGQGTFGSNQYWVALRYNAATASYNQIFSSEKFNSSVARIECGDVTGDSKPEIIVGLGNGQVHVYDQQTKQKLPSFTTTITSLEGFAVKNIDATPKSEIILSGNNKLVVYTEGSLQWTVTGVTGPDIAVGQMDGDPALEIALAGGKVLDAVTRSVQWTNSQAFGTRIDTGDIDGDGMDEIVGAESWYNVWAFDVDTQLPKWSHRADLDITAIALTDVDKDGNLEVAIGDGQWGTVYGIDGKTRALKWQIANPEHSVADITVEDVDNDGQQEVIWAAGFSSTGRDALFVASPATNKIEWESIHLDGPMIGPVIGDLDGDGKMEMIVASNESESSYSSGRILVFDNDTLQLRAISLPIVSDRAWTGLHDLKLRDVDNDGNMEIVIAADYLYDGAIEIYDFSTTNAFTLKWTNITRPEGSPFYSVDVVDINNDGKIEIIGGVGAEHTGSEGIYLYVYSYETKAELWHSFMMGSSFWGAITDVAVADVDSTSGLELLGIPSGSNLYVFDGKTYDPRAIITGAFTNLQVFEKSIFLTDATGKLSQYDHNGSSYALTTQTQLISGAIDGFKVRSKSPLTVQFGSAGRFYVYESGALTIQSQNYGSPYGANWENEVSAGNYCVTANRLPAPIISEEPAYTTGSLNLVSWSSLPLAGHYRVEVSEDPSFNTYQTSGWIKDLSYEFNSLTVETRHYFRMKALGLDGTTESPWSTVTSSYHLSLGPTAATDWTLYE